MTSSFTRWARLGSNQGPTDYESDTESVFQCQKVVAGPSTRDFASGQSS